MSDVIAAPSVRALALQKGIDLEELARDLGRTSIAREDLEGKRPASGPAGDTSYWDVDHSQFGPVTEEPMSRFAQVAAANLGAANALIPQVTHHDRADVSSIEALRKELKPEAQARGVKLTALAFQAKALARALRDFPRFNSSLSPDGKTLTLKDYVHIGIAVDTAPGLMVPVVGDVDLGAGLLQDGLGGGPIGRKQRCRHTRSNPCQGQGVQLLVDAQQDLVVQRKKGVGPFRGCALVLGVVDKGLDGNGQLMP